jgi:hypothetical protein
MEPVDFLLGNVDKQGQLEDDEVRFPLTQLTARIFGRSSTRATTTSSAIISLAASTSTTSPGAPKSTATGPSFPGMMLEISQMRIPWLRTRGTAKVQTRTI